jgi:hypothetical protein
MALLYSPCDNGIRPMPPFATVGGQSLMESSFSSFNSFEDGEDDDEDEDEDDEEEEDGTNGVNITSGSSTSLCGPCIASQDGLCPFLPALTKTTTKSSSAIA